MGFFILDRKKKKFNHTNKKIHSLDAHSNILTGQFTLFVKFGPFMCSSSLLHPWCFDREISSCIQFSHYFFKCSSPHKLHNYDGVFLCFSCCPSIIRARFWYPYSCWVVPYPTRNSTAFLWYAALVVVNEGIRAWPIMYSLSF